MLVRRVVGFFFHLFADEVSSERAFDVLAMVLARALAVRLVEEHVLVTNGTDLERRIEMPGHDSVSPRQGPLRYDWFLPDI